MRHLLVVLLVLLAPATLHAQVVRGQVVESGTRQPLYGSIIVLLDSAGTQMAGAITDEAGRFTLSAPAPGRYTLRANRIGFRSTRSASFILAEGQTLEQTLIASAIPVELDAIQITGKERCTTRPEEGRAAFAVWDEVRTALTAATLTTQQRLLDVNVRHFDRDLEVKSGHVLHERSWEQSGVSTSPFVALPPDRLERNGYAFLSDTGSWYYAPDARVLLSDAFTSHHCFRIQRSDKAHNQLIGLAFEPVKDRKVPDVQGVLWLDRATSELRTMEFHYTGLPRAVPEDRFGGTLAFRRLPTGAWIVQRWVLHMPVIGVTIHQWRSPGSGDPHEQRDTVVMAVHETGGAVLTAAMRNGTPFTLTETAALRGVVFDSSRGAPLAGALVTLAGTADSVRTDSTGAFRLDGLSDGEYAVIVEHPRLDSLALTPLAWNVKLHRGIVSTAQIAVPSLASIARNACPDSLRGPKMALVAGTVRESATGQPLANAQVTVTWKTWDVDMSHGLVSGLGHGVMTTTDGLGHYHACGVPAEVPLTISAQAGERMSAGVAVRPLIGGAVALRDVMVKDKQRE